MGQFLRRLQTDDGLVVGALFDAIAEADLPRSPVVAGGYSNANIIVDQYGRILSAANGSGGGGMAIGGAITSASVPGGVLFENASGQLAESATFYYDAAGSIGSTTTPTTLYIGEAGVSAGGLLLEATAGNPIYLRTTGTNSIAIQQSDTGGDYAGFICGAFTVASPGTGGSLIYAAGTQTVPFLQVKSAFLGSVYWEIEENGYMGIKKTSAPADGDVATSEYMQWLTSTSGAPAVNFKGKDSGGTVFTIALYPNGLRVVTAAGAVTVAKTDYIVVVNKSSGAATTVNLPSSPVTGQVFRIKDGKGDAATNNITITPASGTIDGGSTYVLDINYASIDVVYNGTEWNTL